jgi:hypothetical protein
MTVEQEATRLVNLFGKEKALMVCEELSKVMPNINETPPIKRKERYFYFQFYMFDVTCQIETYH